jgi:4-hydroxy-L-threonine phosphate dehydrogenase PdxA
MEPMSAPIMAITGGDPAGIGPEIMAGDLARRVKVAAVS